MEEPLQMATLIIYIEIEMQDELNFYIEIFVELLYIYWSFDECLFRLNIPFQS